MSKRIFLGVNIDHVATLRQARGTSYPRPAEAAYIAERAGADSITAHLREDRRHIQDHDLDEMNEIMKTHMNLEMAVTDEMIAIARRVRPSDVCLVPEKREELTTEGGLDVAGQIDQVAEACASLGGARIRVSLFIDPDRAQIDAAVAAGASGSSEGRRLLPGRLRRLPTMEYVELSGCLSQLRDRRLGSADLRPRKLLAKLLMSGVRSRRSLTRQLLTSCAS